jgi:hypothetical protein
MKGLGMYMCATVVAVGATVVAVGLPLAASPQQNGVPDNKIAPSATPAASVGGVGDRSAGIDSGAVAGSSRGTDPTTLGNSKAGVTKSEGIPHLAL